jgi:hypothetical protein
MLEPTQKSLDPKLPTNNKSLYYVISSTKSPSKIGVNQDTMKS